MIRKVIEKTLLTILFILLGGSIIWFSYSQESEDLYSNAFYFHITLQRDSSDYYPQKITKNPHNPEAALLQMGVFFRNSKLFTLALYYLKSALKMNEKYKEAWYELGVTYQEMGKDSLEQAKSAFWEVIKLDTEHKMAWFSLSLCYIARNELDNIIDASEKALSLEFESNSVDLDRRIDLSNFRSRYYPGVSWESSSDISYRDAVNLILWTSLGYAYLQKARFNKAITAFEEALKIDSNHAIHWKGLGIAYAQLRMFEKTLPVYLKLTQISPQDVEAWNGLGNAYYYNKLYEKAIHAYRKALEIAPGNQKVWNHLALAYKKRGYFEKAIDAWKTCIKIDPNTLTAFKAEIEIQNLKLLLRQD